ncbi:MAG TPA: hypothetical protein VJU14_04685 [Solirubrobacterales bacterium]|nr:hypothetical protein [Solirubrobacterales bacterium]
MRKVEVEESPTGIEEAHELELTFELTVSRIGHRFREWASEEDTPLGLRFEPASATVHHCQELLESVDSWMRAAITGTWNLDTYLQDMAPGSLGEFGRGAGAASLVRRLHYGSPFQIELLLPLLTPASLAGLFFIARRLYGIDLEFKAYREQRRAEYLEAKEKADSLAGHVPSPPPDVAHPPNRWKLTSGTLRDPSS